MSKRHVQLPNDMTKSDLSPKDLLIYVTIKYYMNAETKEAFPSLEVISKKTSSDKRSVRNAIQKLIDTGYLKKRKKGKRVIYTFNDSKTFEPFSYEFLNKEDLSAAEKAYIIASQQFMFKEDGNGKISLSDRKLGGLINMSPTTVAKYNKALQEKGYLTTILLDKPDPETGLRVTEKFFHLTELEQAIVFTLQKHEEKLNTHEKDIELLKKEIERLNKEIRCLKKEIK